MGSARSYLQPLFVAAVLCLFSGLTDAWKPEVHGKVGGVVELECNSPSSNYSVSSASLRVVEWVRRGLDIPVLIKFGSYTPRVHPQYEGRVSLVQITALRLEALQLDDQGLYDCRILLLDESTDELQNGTWIVLSVTAPPTFTQAPPPAMEALVGSHLTLACVANGNPTPTVTWLKDGRVVQGKYSQEGILSLQAVSPQSAGQYTCHASNSEGNVTRVTKVKIKGPPLIVIPPKSTAVNISQNALLQCQAVADPPNMTYVWHKEGENVYHAESLKLRVKIMVDGTLLISNLIPEDSGNYTCMPTNGLLTPPMASAVLTVMHPARALKMPQQTYLPTGLEGVVTCPVAAQPPLLHVDWTKDGEPLDLSMYPGWTLTSEGSLSMATVNEDASGMYMCTPYNSYGTMGSSGSTTVIVQDPPSLITTPEKQYKETAGRTLLIPCQGKNEDPTVKVTWRKADIVHRTSYSIEPNGSLLLQPLTKDHQGVWECTVANRVASVKASTQVFVLGTSPHAATSLSVSPGVKQVNISWGAGFDGGSAQTFSVWVKTNSVSDNDGKQSWFSVPVPPDAGTKLQVTGLSPNTDYQFSILSHNKMGVGPFSEIATARTLKPPQRTSRLKPPASLSANQSSAGVVLQWSLPEVHHPPITSFVLQCRTEQGQWFNLDKNISANSSEILVPGLHKNCVYQLRLLSRRGELLSEPSASVNVSTMGMESYPVPSQLLEYVPDSLLASVLCVVGFVCLALVLLLGSACVISRRRKRNCRQKNEPPPTIYKRSPSVKTSATSSPESVLKKGLLPASIPCLTTSSRAITLSSSSARTDSSSSSTENQHWQKHSLTNKDGLTRITSSSNSPPVELISRIPDGHFMLSPYDSDTPGVRRSVSLHSEREDRKEPPFVLSVDLPPCSLTQGNSSNQICDITNRQSHWDPDICDQKASLQDYFPGLSSVYSNNSLATVPNKEREQTLTFPVLPHIRCSLGQPSKTASTLVLQMEHEREKGNLSHCLKLAQEREELEMELQKYTLERSSTRSSMKRQNELLWKYKSRTLPHRHPQGSKQNFDLSPSPFSSPSVVPALTRAASPSRPGCCKSANYPLAQSFTSEPLLQPEEAGSHCIDSLILPQLSLKHQKYEKVEASPEGCDNSPQAAVLEMQMNDSCSETQRQNNLSHGSISTLSFQSNKSAERTNSAVNAVARSSGLEVAFPDPTDEEVCLEMSMNEPDLETCMSPSRQWLHHRTTSHVQQGHLLAHQKLYEGTSKSTSFIHYDPAGVEVTIKASPQYSQPKFSRAQHSKIWDSKQQSQSLDSRKRKESKFLTPDAWINSLSQENCSVVASCHPDSLIWEPQSLPLKSISTSSASSPSTTEAASHSPKPMDTLSPNETLERPVSNHKMPQHDEPKVKSPKWRVTYHEAMTETEGSLEPIKEVYGCVPRGDNDLDALEMEAGCYEEVPESGSNYSSYASSGRGSMEPTNGQLCYLSQIPISSSEPVKESQSRAVYRHPHMEPSQRRKASVDENYEWDAADFCTQPGDHGGLLHSLNLLKPAQCRSPPSMQHSSRPLRNCAELSLLLRHQSSCSAGPEPESVLF